MNLDFTNARPKATRDITATEIEGEIVAYSPKPGKGYHLNDSAAWLWKHCDGRHGVDELAAQMRQEFDCAGADVSSDVIKTLQELLASGLIEIEPSPGADA